MRGWTVNQVYAANLYHWHHKGIQGRICGFFFHLLSFQRFFKISHKEKLKPTFNYILHYDHRFLQWSKSKHWSKCSVWLWWILHFSIPSLVKHTQQSSFHVKFTQVASTTSSMVSVNPISILTIQIPFLPLYSHSSLLTDRTYTYLETFTVLDEETLKLHKSVF